MDRIKLKTYADYLAAELASDVRHEFVDGEVRLMAGGTRAHGLVQTGLIVALGSALRGRSCRPFGPDNRVYVPAYGDGLYPDAHIICGRVVADAADPEASTNPSVVFEVLSPGTEAWDRGGKFERYEALSSVVEYVLVHVDRERVERFRRSADGSWNRVVLTAGATLELEGAGGVRVDLDEVYALKRADDGVELGEG